MRGLIESYQLAEPERLDEVEAIASQQNIPFHEALLQSHVLSETNVAQLLAEEHDLPYVNLGAQMIDPAVRAAIPELMMQNHGVMAYKEDEDTVHVAVSDPSDVEIMAALGEYFNKYVDFSIAERSQINRALPASSLLRPHADMPIDELVDAILEYGSANEASEIHLEPAGRMARIRFRVHGLFYDVLSLPKKMYQGVMDRIHRLAPHGHMAFERDGHRHDVHVGENKLRLISERTPILHLADFGLSAQDFPRHGLLLIVGPSRTRARQAMEAIQHEVADDVIIIDELTDTETANKAVQMALHSHLVVSTIRANTADEAMQRLRAMQVPEFAILTAVTVILV